MKKLTPRQAAYKRHDDWALALQEGRIVRYGQGETMRMFLTVEAAEQAVREAGEYPAVIIRKDTSA